MKLVIDKNVAKLFVDNKLIVHIIAPEGICLNAHIHDTEAINVVKVDNVAVEVETAYVHNIDVEQTT